MNIGIVGLGLIGGSFAKSIKSRTCHTVFGIDTNPETMTVALLSGAVYSLLDETTIPKCDIIIVALCPDSSVKWVRDNAHLISKDALLTDICGVKRNVCALLSSIAEQYGFSYIGSHPMAGKESGGFSNACDNLFVGASMILTPDKNTNMQILKTIQDFCLELGFAKLTFSDPDEHDRIIAYTSQLAHITSNAYIKSPTAQLQSGFSAGSYRDLTRVAKLDENMWTELFMSNREYIIDELKLLIENLSPYLDALENSDAERLRSLLKEGRELKATAGGN